MILLAIVLSAFPVPQFAERLPPPAFEVRLPSPVFVVEVTAEVGAPIPDPILAPVFAQADAEAFMPTATTRLLGGCANGTCPAPRAAASTPKAAPVPSVRTVRRWRSFR